MVLRVRRRTGRAHRERPCAPSARREEGAYWVVSNRRATLRSGMQGRSNARLVLRRALGHSVRRFLQPAAGAHEGMRARGGVLAAGISAALVLAAHLWGDALLRAGRPLHLPAPPLYATFDPRISPWAGPAVAVGALAAFGAGRAADRVRWLWLPWLVLAAGAAWAACLALAGGPHALVAPLLGSNDYLHDLAKVGSPGPFLAGFTRDIGTYATHVRAHPPGMLLLAWGLGRIGLGSPAVLAGIVIAAGASAGAAALVALREVSGEQAARRAAPFLALAPAAVWMATSADALFAGVGAWGAALTILATGETGERRQRHLLAFAGGILLGAAVFLSYGLVLLAAVPAVVAAVRRRPGALVVAGLGAAMVAAAFASQGFVWWEGLRATRLQYFAGAGSERPYGYFLLADMAALAVALGPASAAALAGLRDRQTWLLAGAGLLAVAAAALSGLSKAEVERIWLPFMPWLLVATAALPSVRSRAGRGWLAGQLATGLLVQSLFVTPW
jgi:methylthioxylose transferase